MCMFKYMAIIIMDVQRYNSFSIIMHTNILVFVLATHIQDIDDDGTVIANTTADGARSGNAARGE